MIHAAVTRDCEYGYINGDGEYTKICDEDTFTAGVKFVIGSDPFHPILDISNWPLEKVVPTIVDRGEFVQTNGFVFVDTYTTVRVQLGASIWEVTYDKHAGTFIVNVDRFLRVPIATECSRNCMRYDTIGVDYTGSYLYIIDKCRKIDDELSQSVRVVPHRNDAYAFFNAANADAIYMCDITLLNASIHDCRIGLSTPMTWNPYTDIDTYVLEGGYGRGGHALTTKTQFIDDRTIRVNCGYEPVGDITLGTLLYDVRNLTHPVSVFARSGVRGRINGVY